MKRLIIIAILSVASQAHGGLIDTQRDLFGVRSRENQSLTRIAWIPESVVASLEDCATINPLYQPSIRYVFVPAWMPRNTPQIVAGVCNLALSRSEVIYRPVVASVRGGGFVIRIDTAALASNPIELENLQLVFGGLSPEEHYYHVNRDGFTAFGAHTNAQAMATLAARTQSQNPIVRADFFIAKSLSTLNGGRYYEFQGIERNPKGKTAEQAWFESLGATEKDLDATQRLLIRHSEVARRKWRRVDVVHGTKTRPGAATSDVFLTHDISDEQQGDFRSHPARNLVQFADSAREGIGFKTNGLQQFALFNAKGELQNSAPENVVQDDSVPAPFDHRLQGAIGCIRCHSPKDGLKDLVNDAPRLFGGRLNSFGDLSLAKQRDAYQQNQLIAGLYAMRPTKPINRARDDYQEAIYNATGGLSVKEFGEGVSAIFAAREYVEVTPRQALLEWGIVTTDKEATEVLNRVIPRLPADSEGISPEDPDIGALREGGTLGRYDFDQIYADGAFRMLANEERKP